MEPTPTRQFTQETTEAFLRRLKVVTTPATISLNRIFEENVQRALWEVDSDFLDPDQDIPPVTCWCLWGGRQALPKEGVITISAKQKKGKSFATYALAIPLLSGMDFGPIHPIDRPNCIMVFDMELSIIDLVTRLRTQVKVINRNSKLFAVCNLKPKTLEERRQIIQEKVDKYNPDIIVVDQVGQLARNVNDPTEASEIKDFLEKLSIGRSVICVMHENKGNEDSNMRGHLGSQLSQVNGEAYSVSRKNGIFTLTPVYARASEAEGSAPLQFILDESGHLRDGSERQQIERQKEREGFHANFTRIFGQDKYLTSGELKARINKQEHLEYSAAQTKITKGKELGVIRKTGGHKSPFELCPL